MSLTALKSFASPLNYSLGLQNTGWKTWPDFEAIQSVLLECGKLPVRVSTHPGPFNKLAGSGATLANTVRDLEIHAQMFDLMGLAPSHHNKINIHVGGAYGDKEATLERFAENYAELPNNIRLRLTVENDDKPGLFSVAEFAATAPRLRRANCL